MVDNIYHCTVAKAASSFFRILFRDEELRKFLPHKEILHFNVDLKKIWPEDHTNPTINFAFPDNAIVTNTSCDYKSFLKIPKSEDYRGFYFYRDPRELVVSSYWSWRESHPDGHPFRNYINNLSLEEGMKHAVDYLHYKLRCFEAMVDWVENCKNDRFILYKFSNFFQDQDLHLKNLFDHLKIDLPQETWDYINTKYSFENLSGRKKGEIDNKSHYRSGTADSFKTEMPDSVLEYFYRTTGDITERLGYDT